MSDDKRLDNSDPDVRGMVRQHIADQFFVDELPPREPVSPKPFTFKDEMRAMQRFVKALKNMDPHSRECNVRYLADRFLGRRRF